MLVEREPFEGDSTYCGFGIVHLDLSVKADASVRGFVWGVCGCSLVEWELTDNRCGSLMAGVML